MPGPRDVVDERAVAGEQAGVLDSLHPGAGITSCDGLGHGTNSNPSILKSAVIADQEARCQHGSAITARQWDRCDKFR